MDVAAWLRGLGLERYDQAFRDNAIEAEILPDLTDADLEKLGVLLGHRKRLLRAIATLHQAGVSPSPTEPPGEPLAAAPATAERRQLTVMFCDLVGSTALSARLDPEDMRAVIGAYHRCVAEAIEHAGGFVAKYMGDGVLVYFGYPQAQEGEAERAVMAGLELAAAVAAQKPGNGGELACRHFRFSAPPPRPPVRARP